MPEWQAPYKAKPFDSEKAGAERMAAYGSTLGLFTWLSY